MRPVFDAASGDTSAGTGATSSTFSHTCSGSNLGLLVFFSAYAAITNLTCKYNAVDMALLGSDTDASGRTTYAFWLANPTTGAHNVAIAWTTSRNFTATAVSYTRCMGDSPAITFVSKVGTTFATPTLAEGSCSNDLYVITAMVSNASTSSIPTVAFGGPTSRATQTNTLGAAGFRQRTGEANANDGLTTITVTLTLNTQFILTGVYLHGLSNSFVQ